MSGHADATQTVSTDGTKICRITLQEPVPDDLVAGIMVEIDLLGDGVAGYYNRLLINPPASDADGVMVAVELIEQCVSGLREARPATDSAYWTALARRLSVAERLFSIHHGEGSRPLVWLLDHVRSWLFSVLQDDDRHDALRSLIAETLELTLDRCNELVEDATATIRRTRQHFEAVTYGPLHAGAPPVKNHAALVRGFHLAFSLGLDLNTLEVGRCYQDDVIAALRGRKL